MTLESLPKNLELPVLQPRRKPYKFSSENQPAGRGRKKGSVDKITRDLKRGVLLGAHNCGYDGQGLGGVDGFLLYCAQKHPRQYLALLGKMLPMDLNANVSSAMINEVKIYSVPSGQQLTRQAIDAIERHQELPSALVEASLPASAPIERPAPAEDEFKPQTERERQLLAELEALSPEQLLERARQAGYVDVDSV